MKKKKKIIILMTLIIIAVGGALLIKRVYDKNLENFTVKKEGNSFEYSYEESFLEGIKWDLYINGSFAYSIHSFDGFDKKEMKEHLTNVELIEILVNKEKVHVCAIPLNNYKKTYDIFYTIDGSNYYYWNDEAICIDEYDNADEIKKRLAKLYEYISKNELEKISNESWK